MVRYSVASLACIVYLLPLPGFANVGQSDTSEGTCDDVAPYCWDSLPRDLSTPTASLLQVRKESLRSSSESTSKVKTLQRIGLPPCACEADSPMWRSPAPRPPKCIFIDLGAADGNTFLDFVNNKYGPVENCPSGGSYEAILVEANPLFANALHTVQTHYPDTVRTLRTTAAYMCEGEASFFLDTVDKAENYWGSSMSPNARDVIRSGDQKVTVPLVNLARLVYESVLPEDWVMVKMDIEGSEHDIVPCLAGSRAAKLIDALYMEKHPEEWSLAGATPGSLQRGLLALQQQGVQVPEYDSPS